MDTRWAGGELLQKNQGAAMGGYRDALDWFRFRESRYLQRALSW